MAFIKSRVFRGFYFFCLVCVIAISLPRNSATLLFTWPWTGLIQGLLAAPIALALGCLVSNLKSPIHCGRLYVSGGVILVLALGASTCLSPYPDRAWFSLLIPAAAVSLGHCTFCLVAASAEPVDATKHILRALTAGALLVGGIGLWHWLNDDIAQAGRLFEDVNRLIGRDLLGIRLGALRNPHPFGHANYVGGFAVLCVPLAVALVFVDRGLWRFVGFIAALFAVGALLSSGGRAGVLCLGMVAAGALLLYVFYRGPSPKAIVLSASGLAVAACAIIVLHPRFWQTARAILEGRGLGSSDSERLRLVDTGLALAVERPLLGQGLGTVSLTYPKHWDGDGVLSNAFQLHNTPLQLFAELGIVGIAGFALLGAAVIWSWMRLLGEHDTARKAGAVVIGHALFLGLVGYGFFSLSDYQLNVPVFAAFVAVAVGAFAALRAPANFEGKSPFIDKATASARLMVTVGILLVSVLLYLAQWRHLQARSWFDRGLVAMEEERGGEALAAFEKAIAYGRSDAFYLNQTAWILSQDNGRILVSPDLENLEVKAIELLERSLEIDGSQEYCRTNLGWLFASRDPARSAAHFRRAAELVPAKRGVYFGLALALRKMGHDEGAFRALALECLANPMFATFPFWEDERFAEALPEVQAHVRTYFDELRKGEWSVAQAEVRALLQWWWGQEYDPGVFADSGVYNLRWFGRLAAGEELEAEDFDWDRGFATPAAMAYLSRRRPGDAADWIRAAQLLYLKEVMDEEQARAIGQYVSKTDRSYGELLREANTAMQLPYRVYRNARESYGIMAHNILGPVPGDLYIYEQNMFLKLALDPLLPKRSHVPGSAMRRFVEELWESSMESADEG